MPPRAISSPFDFVCIITTQNIVPLLGPLTQSNLSQFCLLETVLAIPRTPARIAMLTTSRNILVETPTDFASEERRLQYELSALRSDFETVDSSEEEVVIDAEQEKLQGGKSYDYAHSLAPRGTDIESIFLLSDTAESRVTEVTWRKSGGEEQRVIYKEFDTYIFLTHSSNVDCEDCLRVVVELFLCARGRTNSRTHATYVSKKAALMMRV